MRILALVLLIGIIFMVGCAQTPAQNQTPAAPHPQPSPAQNQTQPPAPSNPPPPPANGTQPPANTTPQPPPSNATPPPPPPNVTPSPPQPAVKEFTVEADDLGFYPAGPISVNKGDDVKITFKVRTSGVYHSGLQFISSKFSSGQILPGDSKTEEFTADQDLTITSYWGASMVKKADLLVKVS